VSLSGPTAPNLASPGASPAQWASGHYVTAEFQEALTATPDPVDWTILGSAVALTPSSVNSANVTYQGSLAFPTTGAFPGAKHRVLFREYEVYAADAQDGVREGIGVVQVGANNTSYRTRLVYADAIAISN
jgi:hypothetical protein